MTMILPNVSHTLLPPEAQAKLRSAAQTPITDPLRLNRAIAIDKAAAEIRKAMPQRFRPDEH